jgi:hypothetical protein
MDSAGNLYGATGGGGSGFFGTVFELKRTGKSSWTEIVLHSFPSSTTDGMAPDPAVLLDSQGNLYGTTYDGGTVFEITP